jgi:hypothetical protein
MTAPRNKSRKRAAYLPTAKGLNEIVQQQQQDIRFLLELKDAPTDGKWDWATIQRIDEIRKRAAL